MKVNSKDQLQKITFHLKFLQETHFQLIQLEEDLLLQEVQAEFNNLSMLIKIRHHLPIFYHLLTKAISDLMKFMKHFNIIDYAIFRKYYKFKSN